jgi:hypothetical protein
MSQDVLPMYLGYSNASYCNLQVTFPHAKRCETGPGARDKARSRGLCKGDWDRRSRRVPCTGGHGQCCLCQYPCSLAGGGGGRASRTGPEGAEGLRQGEQADLTGTRTRRRRTRKYKRAPWTNVGADGQGRAEGLV